MANDLVSIIMLSRNQGQYVEESVRSVINQTYKNWELLFIDDNSTDDTIHQMMELKSDGRWYTEDGRYVDRVKVSKTVYKRGHNKNSNAALKEARGRWIAFLNVGDVWTPDKLEKQIAFMEGHGYAFSYHQYRLMDAASKDRGYLMSGKEHVTHKDLLKCCWPAYLTVMYDAEKVGQMYVRSELSNYYALWLSVSDRNDCYLLPESLASLRTEYNKMGIILTKKTRWRYDAYRLEEDLGRCKSFLYSLRNGWYGLVKWHQYVRKES